jgi:S-formylglutathione hydrolase
MTLRCAVGLWLLGVSVSAGGLRGGEAPATSVAPAGRVVVESIDAPSLAGNRLGDPARRDVAVYLPPSYDRSPARRWPVVYFLGGFGDGIGFYLSGRYQGFALPRSADDALARTGRELILVVVSGSNRFRGSFYVNSPVTGNWEDHVVREIVGHIDAHYRTLAAARARGIAGHSMGGFGALNLAMRHPDVFGACDAMSPGLVAPEAFGETPMIGGGATAAAFVQTVEALRAQPAAPARAGYLALGETLPAAGAWAELIAHAYAAAFADNPGAVAPYADYPYRMEDGGLVFDPACWARWERGFGGWAEKIAARRAALAGLRGLAIEYGLDDENAWIPRGCAAVAADLRAAGIAHTLTAFAGRHEDRLGERLTGHMLPFFAAVLADE